MQRSLAHYGYSLNINFLSFLGLLAGPGEVSDRSHQPELGALHNSTGLTAAPQEFVAGESLCHFSVGKHVPALPREFPKPM